jgi:Fuc2NAc and GlcNAc transferase
MREMTGWYALPAAFLLSVAGTGLVRRWALRRGLLDVPGERSSHRLPVPRGGGLAVAVVSLAAIVALHQLGFASHTIVLPLVIGGLAVAAIGLIDDVRTVRVPVRLLVHAFAASAAVYWLGGIPPLQIGSSVIDLGWWGDVLGVVGVMWAINLFNFIDGIDGIAGSQAAFITLSSAALGAMSGTWGDLPLLAAVIGAASLGFLVWNWPPAKIFLGDVGSGYLGFTIAVLMIAASAHDPVALFAWLILGAACICDATATLIRRALRGENVFRAHRTHVYQLLAQRWGRHARVSGFFLLIGVCVLLPLAAYSLVRPHWAAPVFALVALAGGAVMLAAGAGKPPG